MNSNRSHEGQDSSRPIIIEIKSTERLAVAAKRQLRSSVTAMDFKLGLLLHFGPRANVHRVLGRKRPDETRPHSLKFE
jgi:hypothetical protein